MKFNLLSAAGGILNGAVVGYLASEGGYGLVGFLVAVGLIGLGDLLIAKGARA